jgi:TolA-binding protein
MLLLVGWSSAKIVSISRSNREKETQIKQLQMEIHNLQNDQDGLMKEIEKLEQDLQAKAKAEEQKKQIAAASTSTIKYTSSGNSLPDDNVCVVAMKKYFPQNQWDIAKAVIRGESGGNPTAVSATNDHGCFQLHNWPLYNPEENAKGAYSKFSRYGWSPWTVYTSGKYLKYL